MKALHLLGVGYQEQRPAAWRTWLTRLRVSAEEALAWRRAA
jgi:hypothetical protein